MSNENKRKRHQKYALNRSGHKVPIKSKMRKGYFIAFESLTDTTQLAKSFANSIRESNPKLTIFFMRFPTYWEIEKETLKFLNTFNDSVMECNLKYFEDENVKRTIDSLNEYQVNNRLNIMSSVNYIQMLPILSRINKINHLHTHYNIIVAANYFNSIKALAVNNQHIYRAMKFIHESYVPKPDMSYLIDISATKIQPILEDIKYEYFHKESIEKYRLALLNMTISSQSRNKVDIVDYDDDHRALLVRVLKSFKPLEKYITKSAFN